MFVRQKILYLLLFAPALFFLSCRRDTNGPSNEGPIAIDAARVTASITGVVVNESNIPQAGVTVTSGDNTATTDRYGMFRFSNISVSKNNAAVRVSASGYFTAYRTFPATAGATHNVRIKLIPKTNAGSFSAATGGTINITGGGKVTIPASAISDAAGNIYSGTVNVAMTWIDPTAPDLGSIIMGDLRGITTGGEERVLETYGMLGVELTGSNGEQLNMASGKTAELTFPIPASIQSGAPATIPLWHFDEITARWKEEGTATKTGPDYIANVHHFSFWNCDAPSLQVNLCLTLVCNNKPFVNANVLIRRVNVPTSIATGRTDSAGNVCGFVPKDEPLILEVMDDCGNMIYTQNIGPFSTNASLGTISVTVPASSIITITGSAVTCNHTPVANGSVLVLLSNGQYHAGTVSNGNFAIQVVGSCINTSYTALLTDNATGLQGNPVTVNSSGSTVNLGILVACGFTAEQYMRIHVDSPGAISNLVYNWSAPLDTVTIFSTTTIGGMITGDNSYFISFVTPVTNNYASIIMDYSSMGPGALVNVNINIPSQQLSAQTMITPGYAVITELGPPSTGYIAGIFGVQMSFNTVPGWVTGSFRVRRP